LVYGSPALAPLYSKDSRRQETAGSGGSVRRGLKRLGKGSLDLRNRWALAMPIGMLLEQPRCRNHLVIIKRSTDELDSNGQPPGIHAARHAHRRESTEVSYPAQRIGEIKISLEVRSQRRSGDR